MGPASRLAAAIVICVLLFGIAGAQAQEVGAIKRFKEFPVDTFDLDGQMMSLLQEATTPSPSQITVNGWWPDEKMLLITFRPLDQSKEDSFLVLYRAVEMVDEARWKARMTVKGNLVCLNGRTRTVGSNPKSRVAGTKGFTNPC
jgi:hypothetical protein